MSFAQWINDRRWAANMRRARSFRRSLSFSERRVFDAALRPGMFDDTMCVAYPDAFYAVQINDLLRAMQAVINRRYQLCAYGDPEDH